jgi:GDPmannose 4,6-dehydratase
MKKKALIIGVTGQDGIYLAKLLLSKDYKVFGTTRGNKKNLIKTGLINKVKLFTIKKTTELNLTKVLNFFFDEIYFLGGQTNVMTSFKNQVDAYESQITPVKIIIDFIQKQKKKKSKFLFAASSEIYGQKNDKKKCKEKDEKNPLSPYALSKLICFEIIKSYREMFNLPICSIILFNHESIYRAKGFVIPKIINTIKKIKKNKNMKLIVGNVNVKRDWGWAPEYMYGCYKVLNSKKIDDYNIATGKTVSLRELILYVFEKFKLNYKNHLQYNKKFIRRLDISENYADLSKIKKNINWYPKNKYKKVIDNILAYNEKS